MKLRNKKTGEIIDFEPIQFYLRHECKDPSNIFESLSELNEEWEDYVPKEPLIKDEKICKAVRAWAKANNFAELRFVEWSDDHWVLRAVNEDGHDFDIDFYDVASRNLPKYVYGSFYTINELCGEEEK